VVPEELELLELEDELEELDEDEDEELVTPLEEELELELELELLELVPGVGSSLPPQADRMATELANNVVAITL
jgi:hypothetical protein